MGGGDDGGSGGGLSSSGGNGISSGRGIDSGMMSSKLDILFGIKHKQIADNNYSFLVNC